MNIIQVMTDYLRAEKLEALIFILPIGLLSLVFGAWLLVDAKDAFSRGVAWPFVVMGMVLIVTGGAVGFRTPAQVDQLTVGFTEQPEATRTEEIARMEKVNAAWPKYRAVWVLFALVGLALRFGLKQDFAQGVGIALVFFGGAGLIVDGFAERRAFPYADALRHSEAIVQTTRAPLH